MIRTVARDEREVSVDQVADRWSYMVVTFGLLAIVAYRGLVHDEASWDLLALVIASGAVGMLVRVRERVITRSWLVAAVIVAVVSAVAAIVAVLATRA